jgi:hypothetical protein
MTAPAVLVVVSAGVTLLEFPIGFGQVVASDAWGVALLFVRNGLLVAAALTAARRLWRSTVPPRPRGREAGAREGQPSRAAR